MGFADQCVLRAADQLGDFSGADLAVVTADDIAISLCPRPRRRIALDAGVVGDPIDARSAQAKIAGDVGIMFARLRPADDVLIALF